MRDLGRLINACCRRAKSEREWLTPQLFARGVAPKKMKYVPAADGAKLICRGEVV